MLPSQILAEKKYRALIKCSKLVDVFDFFMLH